MTISEFRKGSKTLETTMGGQLDNHDLLNSMASRPNDQLSDRACHTLFQNSAKEGYA
jgi:hypothetical protein